MVREFLILRESLVEAFRKETQMNIKREFYPDLYKGVEKYYPLLFGKAAKLDHCTKLFECFNDFKNLKNSTIMKKLELQSKLKAGRNFRIDGKYYNSFSPHLTNEVCRKIYEQFGKSVFEVYVEAEDRELPAEVEKITSKTFDEVFEIKPDLKTPVTDEMTVKELKAFADDNKIAVTKRKKNEIIDEINEKWL